MASVRGQILYQQSPDDEAESNAIPAEAFKKEIHIPLILVGGFLSFTVANEAVTSGLTDYVALSRPLIREPHLVSRWADGDKTKAKCISCNKCFLTLGMDEALHCFIEKKSKE